MIKTLMIIKLIHKFSTVNFIRKLTTPSTKKRQSTPSIKNSFTRIILNISDVFDQELFIYKIKEYFNHNSKYKILVKLTCLEDSESESIKEVQKGFSYLVCGPQISFHYENDISFTELTDDINSRVEQTLADYKLNELQVKQVDIVCIKVNVDVLTKYKLTKAEKEFLQSHFNDKRAVDVDLRSLNIDDSKEIGKSLVTTTANGFITSILLDDKTNFLDKIMKKSEILSAKSPNKIDKLEESWKFYSISLSNKKYIMGYRESDSKIEKIKFGISGNIISLSNDNLDSNKNVLKSSQGKHVVHYVNDNETNVVYDEKNRNVISHVDTNIILDPLPKAHNIPEIIPNTNIGVFDFEVYQNENGDHVVYAIGYKTNLDSKTKTYYITDYKSSQEMLTKFLFDIMAPKYNYVTFYCHNGGKYDFIFLLKSVLRYNKEVKDLQEDSEHKNMLASDYEVTYQTQHIFNGNRMLKLKIRHSFNKKRYVTMVDSFSILSSSLSKLCESFDLEQNKGIFPYSFVKDNTLLYIGNKPDISYYDSLTVTKAMYEEIPGTNWSTKDKTLEYLTLDVDCLYSIICKFNDQLFNDYNLSIQDKPTITGLASKLFMSEHYKRNIPNINKANLYNDIHNAYYGGNTEVYKPYGKNLYYYDVNSLYPYVALNDLPGPGNCIKTSFINSQPILNDLFGFYYCDIETSKDSYIGLLPFRDKDKGLTFPLGKFSGWYFSEELKFAADNGYKIHVHNGYTFNRQKDVFKSYINKVYNLKLQSKDKVQRTVAKSMLNNLLGRFGINLYKSKTQIVDFVEFHKILNIHPVVNHHILDDDNILITYKNYIDPDIIKNSDLDISKVMQDNPKLKEISVFDLTSVSTSAAITSYARIHMAKIKLNILNNNGKIYYTDTDSIVTDKMLPEDMVSPHELGKLKLEHKVKFGIFVAGKTYYLSTVDNGIVKRAKGIISDNLSRKDYVELITKGTLTKSNIKRISKTDWSLGEVIIKNIDANINPFKLDKRIKIYDNNKNNHWYDTKPHIINKSIINKKNSFYKAISSRSMSTVKQLYYNTKVKPLLWMTCLDLSILYLYTIFLLLLVSSTISFIYNYTFDDVSNIININSENIEDSISEIYVDDDTQVLDDSSIKPNNTSLLDRLLNREKPNLYLLDMSNYNEEEFSTVHDYEFCSNQLVLSNDSYVDSGINTENSNYNTTYVNNSTNTDNTKRIIENQYVHDMAVNAEKYPDIDKLYSNHPGSSYTVNCENLDLPPRFMLIKFLSYNQDVPGDSTYTVNEDIVHNKYTTYLENK